MDLPSPLLVLSHLLAFSVGGLTFWAFTRYEARKVAPEMFENPKRKRRIPTLAAVLLAASALLIGFGIQQTVYQRHADERDACYTAWGQGVYNGVTTARSTNIEIEKAEAKVARKDKAREDVYDEIVGFVIDSRRIPPIADEVDLNDILDRFQSTSRALHAARVELRAVRQNVAKTREDNPYPRLDC